MDGLRQATAVPAPHRLAAEGMEGERDQQRTPAPLGERCRSCTRLGSDRKRAAVEVHASSGPQEVRSADRAGRAQVGAGSVIPPSRGCPVAVAGATANYLVLAAD